jgi:hypothetical protein
MACSHIASPSTHTTTLNGHIISMTRWPLGTQPSIAHHQHTNTHPQCRPTNNIVNPPSRSSHSPSNLNHLPPHSHSPPSQQPTIHSQPHSATSWYVPPYSASTPTHSHTVRQHTAHSFSHRPSTPTQPHPHHPTVTTPADHPGPHAWNACSSTCKIYK